MYLGTHLLATISAPTTLPPTPWGKPVLIAPLGANAGLSPEYQWRPVTNATEYELSVTDSTGSRISGTWRTAAELGCGTGVCRITPGVTLTAGTVYWWVRAKDAAGAQTSWSDQGLFYTGLAAPTLVSPTGTLVSQMPEYRWQTVAGATGYDLYVVDRTGVKIGPNYWFEASAIDCSGGVCRVQPATTLAYGAASWWVRARDASGNGPWSPEMAITVGIGPTTLIAPIGVGAANPLTFQWNAVPGSSFYQLWVSEGSTPRIQQWFTAAATNCASGTGTCSLAPSTPLVASADSSVFTWWVQTGNDTAGYAWSDPLTFKRLAAASQVGPSGTVVTATPTYEWVPVTSATWYQLWVTDSVSGVRMQTWYTAAEASCNGANSTCSVTPAIPVSGTVWWWIQAWSADNGYGPWSTGLQFVR